MIPIPLNPVGVDNQDFFTITVTPGGTGYSGQNLGMTYQLQLRGPKGAAYYINWGDGTVDQATIAATDTRQTHSHTYTVAGTYTIKIQSKRVNLIIAGQLYQSHDYTAPYASLVYDCNFNWKALPNISQLYYSFAYCRNARYKITNLPSTITNATAVFYQNDMAHVSITQLPNLQYSDRLFYRAGCNTQTTYTLTKLPDNLGKGNGDVSYMFAYSNLVANLDQLVANAPINSAGQNGWSDVQKFDYMFAGCKHVTGSKQTFTYSLPIQTSGQNTAYIGTNTTA